MLCLYFSRIVSCPFFSCLVLGRLQITVVRAMIFLFLMPLLFIIVVLCCTRNPNIMPLSIKLHVRVLGRRRWREVAVQFRICAWVEFQVGGGV